MQIGRLIRHATATHWRTRMIFPAATLDAIEQAIKRAELTHAGEIRFAIETSLTPRHILNDITPRAHALVVFSQLRVWDTEANNGVLIYLLRADRAVEIIADRGINARVTAAEWEQVCRQVEAHYRAGRYVEGSRAAVAGVAGLLAQHFPAARASGNELPNQAILI